MRIRLKKAAVLFLLSRHGACALDRLLIRIDAKPATVAIRDKRAPGLDLHERIAQTDDRGDEEAVARDVVDHLVRHWQGPHG